MKIKIERSKIGDVKNFFSCCVSVETNENDDYFIIGG